MLHHRHLWTVLISLSSIFALAIALNQFIYSASALIETSGTVVMLRSAPGSQFPNQSSTIAVRFLTERGEAVVLSGHIAADRSARLGDQLPVTYFPWAPDQGRIGPVAQSASLAIGIQWLVVAVCGLFGLGGCIVSTHRLPLARHQQLYLLGIYLGIVVLLVAFPILPRPSAAM